MGDVSSCLGCFRRNSTRDNSRDNNESNKKGSSLPSTVLMANKYEIIKTNSDNTTNTSNSNESSLNDTKSDSSIKPDQQLLEPRQSNTNLGDIQEDVQEDVSQYNVNNTQNILDTTQSLTPKEIGKETSNDEMKGNIPVDMTQTSNYETERSRDNGSEVEFKSAIEYKERMLLLDNDDPNRYKYVCLYVI